MNEHLKLSFIGIAAWWMLLLPFDYALFDWLFKLIQQPFLFLLSALDEDLLFETDTYGTYVLLALSLLLGVLSSPLIHWMCSKWKLNPTQVLKTVLAGILFFFLFKYGWDKIIKMQFYQPEPNILFTPFGKLSKDIAYWSLAGSSYAYTVTLGIAEVLTALLLLFKRTQFLASLLAIGIFGQIVLINCSFDISVKLLSGSLLLFSIVYSFCFTQNWRGIFGFSTSFTPAVSSRKRQILKFGFAFLVILECILPSVLSGNLNDDRFPRLPHHGAYAVIGNPQVKRLFIHRNQYLILQSHEDVFTDYPINTRHPERYHTINQELVCDWDNNLLLIQNDTFALKQIPWKQLPLLEESFHPFSDEFH